MPLISKKRPSEAGSVLLVKYTNILYISISIQLFLFLIMKISFYLYCYLFNIFIYNIFSKFSAGLFGGIYSNSMVDC